MIGRFERIPALAYDSHRTRLDLRIPLQKLQWIDENHLPLTCGCSDSRQHDRGGDAPVGNEGQIVESNLYSLDGVGSSRLHSIDIRE
jgi:hypothetical protein